MDNDFLNANGVVEQTCSVCGEQLTKFGSKQLKDGILCRNCAKLASEWLTDEDYLNMSIEDMKNHLQYRKDNSEKVKAFKASKVIEGKYSLYIDDDNKQFLFSKRKDLIKDNPDVIDYADLKEISVYEQQYLKEKTFDIFFSAELGNKQLSHLDLRVNEFPGLDRDTKEFKEASEIALAYLDALVAQDDLELELEED